MKGFYKVETPTTWFVVAALSLKAAAQDPAVKAAQSYRITEATPLEVELFRHFHGKAKGDPEPVKQVLAESGPVVDGVYQVNERVYLSSDRYLPSGDTWKIVEILLSQTPQRNKLYRMEHERSGITQLFGEWRNYVRVR